MYAWQGNKNTELENRRIDIVLHWGGRLKVKIWKKSVKKGGEGSRAKIEITHNLKKVKSGQKLFTSIPLLVTWQRGLFIPSSLI